jgi:RHS repeat-associated protein
MYIKLLDMRLNQTQIIHLLQHYFRINLINSLSKVCGLITIICLSIPLTSMAGEGVRKEVQIAPPFLGQTDSYINNGFETILNSRGFLLKAEVTNRYYNKNEIRKKINNIISLTLNEKTLTLLPDTLSLTVNIEVSYRINAFPTDTTNNPYTILNTSLTINYNKKQGQKYKLRDYFTLENMEEVRIKITSNPNWSASGFNPYSVVTLDNTMEIERYYILSQSQTTNNTSTSLTPVSTSNSNIVPDAVNFIWEWQNDPLHNFSQIEWTWVEDVTLASYGLTTSSSSSDKTRLFNNNATRVDLQYPKKSFKIPLMYDGKGKIYARVRPVSYDEFGNRTDAPWSDIIEQTPIVYPDFANKDVDHQFNGHQPNLNWQVTTTFAEEGKSKTVISYFDGSLRSRQTSTKDNEKDITITAETMYDLQGRPAIQILPTPGIDGIIRYQKDLNRFNGQVNLFADPAEKFDLLPTSPSLLTTSGSSKYYSSNNATGNQNIPNAGGYPFSVTRFTPDATGRIQEQSGVGDKHQIGSGKTTKYYYTKPTQGELDGLFGTEVGDNSHYSKNMVRDANGQVSVSYIDMHGRTIATALAGEKPPNLNALPSDSFPPMTSSLISSSNNIVKGNKMVEAVTSISTSAVNTNYQFNYTLDPAKLNVISCDVANPFCLDVIYNLEFSITKDDEEDPAAKPTILVFTNKPDTFNASIQNCSTNTPKFRLLNNNNPSIVTQVTPTYQNSNSSISFQITLAEIGTYTIRKTLTIDDSSFQAYAKKYAENSTCKTLQNLIDEQFNLITTATGCATNNSTKFDCVTCNASLGVDETAFTIKLYPNGFPSSISNNPIALAKLNAEIHSTYLAEKAKCDKLCSNTISQTLPTIRQLMLSDMKPFVGQYATQNNISSDNTATSTYKKYNILYSPTAVTNKPFYKYPLAPNSNCTTSNCNIYYNLVGLKDMNAHGLNPQGTATKLQDMSAQDFSQNYLNTWLNSLLPYHPEYQKLIFSEKYLKAAYDWLNVFNNTNTWADAVTAGYINPTSTVPGTSTTAIDPLFIQSTSTPTVTPPALTSLYNSINYDYKNSGLSAWQIAYGKLFCSDFTCISNAPSNPAVATNQYASANLTTAQKNSVWTTFKGVYVAERTRILTSYINSQSLNQTDCEAIALEMSIDNATKNAYILHFPKNEEQQISQSGLGTWWTTNQNVNNGHPTLTDTINNNFSTAIEKDKESKCSGYINRWKFELLNCPSLAGHSNKEAIINDIVTRMKAVCKYGYDAENPYGSSNVAPNTPNSVTERSFEEVIQNVFNANGITIDNLCNPYVIEWPKPYGKGPVMIATVSDSIKTCNCNNFINILNNLPNPVSSYNFNSLNIYLQNKYGETLSQQLYDALKKCPNYPTDSSSQNMTESQMQTIIKLDHPSEIPQFIKCGFNPSERCISCIQMKQLVADYKTYFSGKPWAVAPVLSSDTLINVELEANIIFGKFVNYKTGLQFSWLDYLQAINKAPCSIDSSITSQYNNSVICGSSAPLTTPNIIPNDPCLGYMQYAINIAQNIYSNMVQTKLADFERAYRTKALEAQNNEIFTETHANKEYHFTLYYYDQAGNLVKTVPPAGVDNKRGDAGFLSAVALKRFKYPSTNIYNYGSLCIAQLTPDHTLTTNYRYNTLNQVVAQNTPDAGNSNFWYDALGRLVVSQNAKQAVNSATGNPNYSYTLYDGLGRIIEVGQLPSSYSMTDLIARNKNELFAWLTKAQNNNAGGSNFSQNNPGKPNQVTRTDYDLTYFQGTGLLIPNPLIQQNLRNRVSYTTVFDVLNKVGMPLPGCHNFATYYTYDIHGNVDALVQDYGSSDVNNNTNTCNNTTVNNFNSTDKFKKITYNYDLISGKVNQVNYQPNQLDQFYHRYNYDAENRLTSVQTSHDNIYWEKDASYSYYQHGPLQRTALGEFEVQGIDYAYTIQGWLKGVNSNNLTVSSSHGFDMGQDGIASNPFARDVFGFTLNYFNNDYTPIGLNSGNYKNPFANVPVLTPLTDNTHVGKELFNGNISSMLVNIPILGGGVPMLYGYRYDQLNRIVAMNAHTTTFNATNTDMFVTTTQQYKERVSYDANGNILTYLRNGDASRLSMDEMTYSYKTISGNKTNQLDKVVDIATDAATSEYDKYKDIKNGQGNNNYQYDKIGNLIADLSEGITNIDWTVYGKIEKITKVNGTVIKYSYDASGNRISKVVIPSTGSASETWYVRDASGNVMSIYEKKATLNNNNLTQTDVHLYGSSRLGIMNVNRQVQNPPTVALPSADVKVVSNFIRGNKVFELSNHLGNVLVTITDKKIQIANSSSSGISHYQAEIVTASDYYPFGMLMPGRNTQSNLQGGFSSGGTTTVNGNTYISNLTVTTRIGNTPNTYKAANSIEFIGEYADNGNEEYEAFIVNQANPDPNPTTGTVYSSSIDGYRYGFNGMELDNSTGESNLDFGARIMDVRLGRWLTVDPLQKKYPNFSPYNFCVNNPLLVKDPDGKDIYILFYTTGNKRGDEMFRAAALTRQSDIEKGANFDPLKDKVVVLQVQDMAKIKEMVKDVVKQNSSQYGKTTEFSIWSHAGIGGPTGTVKTSQDNLATESGVALDRNQMTIAGWGKIDFNWKNDGKGTNANFFGCNTGRTTYTTKYEVSEDGGTMPIIFDNPSFANKISNLSNFNNVNVAGQTTSAYPSQFVNYRLNSESGEDNFIISETNKNVIYNKTYLVGGEPSLGGINTDKSQTIANPLQYNKNGQTTKMDFQKGKKKS